MKGSETQQDPDLVLDQEIRTLFSTEDFALQTHMTAALYISQLRGCGLGNGRDRCMG